jgi:hypothetical protein
MNIAKDENRFSTLRWHCVYEQLPDWKEPAECRPGSLPDDTKKFTIRRYCFEWFSEWLFSIGRIGTRQTAEGI